MTNSLPSQITLSGLPMASASTTLC